MTKLEDVQLEAINLDEGVVLSDIGIGRVVKWLDEEGDETGDMDMAASVIVQWEAGGWSNVQLDVFDWSETAPTRIQ